VTEPALGRELNDPELVDAVWVFDAHRDELMALIYGAGDDIQRRTARIPNRLLVPAVWGVRREVVNNGFFMGKQILVVDGVDKPMLGYGVT
jgi:hypothetical protein